MMANPRRRPLSYRSLDDVKADLERLLAGHETVGNWTLAQICRHLIVSLRGSVEGFPGIRTPWLLRRVGGPIAFRYFHWVNRLPEGVKAPAMTLPRGRLRDREEAEALVQAIDEFRRGSAPPVEHPIFGRLSRAEWERMHCLHAAHHLSFAIPRESN